MKKTSLVMMDTSLPFTWHQMSLPWSNQWIKPLQEEIVTKAIDRRWEWCISHQLPEVSEYENCHRANRGVMGWNQGIHAMQVMGEDHAYLRTKGEWRSVWRTGRWRWRWATIYTGISGVGIEYIWMKMRSVLGCRVVAMILAFSWWQMTKSVTVFFQSKYLTWKMSLNQRKENQMSVLSPTPWQLICLKSASHGLNTSLSKSIQHMHVERTPCPRSP